MGEKPFIVACIPVVNEEDNIAKVVLLAQKYVDKVIVCDNLSGSRIGREACWMRMI